MNKKRLPLLHSRENRYTSHPMVDAIESLCPDFRTFSSSTGRLISRAFVDAYDWAMQPNSIGMEQFADSGVLPPKPYLASASYITKMSDSCQVALISLMNILEKKIIHLISLTEIFYSVIAIHSRLKFA